MSLLTPAPTKNKRAGTISHSGFCTRLLTPSTLDRLSGHAALRRAPIARTRAAADGAHLHRVGRARREAVNLHAPRLREDAARQPARAVLILRLIRPRVGHRLARAG